MAGGDACCGPPKQKSGRMTGGDACCGPPKEKSAEKVRREVSEYYGSQIQTKEDLMTNACCTGESVTDHIRPIVGEIHDEVVKRYYGCGLCVPDALEGLSVLDLGSGAGRDCFIVSKLVGEKGRVVGVDMTDEQLKVANEYRQWHADKFGYRSSNVEFRKGYIEKLDEVGLGDESFDTIISNCVINLSPDKEAVLREAFRVLKVGGEMYFSDVYALGRVPEELRQDPVLFGECISGALYWNDFIALAKKCGFTDPRVASEEPFLIENKDLERKVGGINFISATVRLFKLPNGLDAYQEDHGVAVRYLGTVSSTPNYLPFDGEYTFRTGYVINVSGNTYRMLQTSRFAEHFEFYGDMKNHYGPWRGDAAIIGR